MAWLSRGIVSPTQQVKLAALRLAQLPDDAREEIAKQAAAVFALSLGPLRPYEVFVPESCDAVCAFCNRCYLRGPNATTLRGMNFCPQRECQAARQKLRRRMTSR